MMGGDGYELDGDPDHRRGYLYRPEIIFKNLKITFDHCNCSSDNGSGLAVATGHAALEVGLWRPKHRLVE